MLRRHPWRSISVPCHRRLDRQVRKPRNCCVKACPRKHGKPAKLTVPRRRRCELFPLQLAHPPVSGPLMPGTLLCYSWQSELALREFRGERGFAAFAASAASPLNWTRKASSPSATPASIARSSTSSAGASRGKCDLPFAGPTSSISFRRMPPAGIVRKTACRFGGVRRRLGAWLRSPIAGIVFRRSSSSTPCGCTFASP